MRGESPEEEEKGEEANHREAIAFLILPASEAKGRMLSCGSLPH
jgi:hypothetical protein